MIITYMKYLIALLVLPALVACVQLNLYSNDGMMEWRIDDHQSGCRRGRR